MLDVTARRLTDSHSRRQGRRWKQLRFWAAESAAWRSATTSATTSASSTRRIRTTAATSTAKSRMDSSGTMVRTCPTRRTNTSSSCFRELVGGEFEEVQAEVVNYYKGHWIDHPAQSNLYQIPEPLRTQCLNSFLESRVERSGRAGAAGELRGMDSPGIRPRLRRHVSGRLHPQVLDAGAGRPRNRLDRQARLLPEGRRRDGRRQGPARTLHLLGESVAISVDGRLLHLHAQAGRRRQDRVRQEAGLHQLSEAPARIRGRHPGEFRDAGVDPAAAGADSVRRGRAGGRARGGVDAEGHAAAAGARGGQSSLGPQGALAVRLRRGQDQHARQHPGELFAAQRSGGQDGALGRGVRLGLQAASDRPERGGRAGPRAS